MTAINQNLPLHKQMLTVTLETQKKIIVDGPAGDPSLPRGIDCPEAITGDGEC